MVTNDELKEWRRLEAAASPGPWEYDGQHYEITTPKGEWYWLIMSECRSAPDQTCQADEYGHKYDGNFAFIAAARTAVPVLLAELARLQAELDKKETA
jgi:hypothetical protein